MMDKSTPIQVEVRKLQIRGPFFWDDAVVGMEDAPWEAELRISIGEKGVTGTEDFLLRVYNAVVANRYLLLNDDMELLKHVLLTRTFEVSSIEQFVHKYVETIEAYNWDEVMIKMSAFAEFLP